MSCPKTAGGSKYFNMEPGSTLSVAFSGAGGVSGNIAVYGEDY